MSDDEPTDALPTRPHWAEIAAHRPLEADDPREVGGYRLRAKLGEGGMGRVYLSNTPGGRPIALKLIRDEYADDPAFRRRFEQEVLTAQRVQGLYTAPVIDANTRSEQPWLATAYVAGPSLQVAVGVYGALPVESVLILVAGVAEALQSIHAAGVVHRDLKPSNVILSADGPRVIDFGIARAVDTTSVTQAGMRVGTPAFMAPEQVRGQPVTQALDIFALGTMACYAATGELPFGGGLDPAVPYRILEQEPDLAALPPALHEIVTRCLAKDPRMRPSPAQVIDLCRQASTGTMLQMGDGWLPPAVAAAVSRIAVAPVPPPVPQAKPKRRRGTAVAVSLAVVAAAAGVGGAALAGAFDDKAAGQTPPGNSTSPEETTTTPTTSEKTTSTTSSTTSSSRSTTTTSSKPPTSEKDPQPLATVAAVDVAQEMGVNLDEPTAIVTWGDNPNVVHWLNGSLRFNSAHVVILDPDQAGTYQTCITDTRFATPPTIDKPALGTRFCVLTEQRIGLFEIKKTPEPGNPSQYFEFSAVIWNAPPRR